jgi:hypothetical protein
MANTGMSMGRWVSPTPEDQAVRTQLQKLQHEFIACFVERAKQHGLNPRALLITSPHDSVTSLVLKSVVLVISKGTATDATSTDSYGDFRSQPMVTAEDLIRDSRTAFGWVDVTYWVFDVSIFTDADARKSAFVAAAEKTLSEIGQKASLTKQLGISEAMTFLQNARSRFESGSPAGYNDCKANCRSALSSLITGLSGERDTRTGIKTLAARGDLGEREAESVQAIEDLVGALKGLASKKGAHPPLGDEVDAAFTLRLTEATCDYLVRTVATSRGL